MNVAEALLRAHTDARKKAQLPTDDELAHRWEAAHPLTAWDGSSYRRYNTDGIWAALPEDQILSEIQLILLAAKPEGVRPTVRLRNSVLELARVDISIPPARWDADPDILLCRNGALQLSTRQLKPHDPSYRATAGVEYDYDPAATAPAFLKVLDTVCPADAKDFLQDFAGLCVTPDMKYEVALWLHSPPGGGKSTVLEGFHAALGPRARLLTLTDIERSRFGLQDLPGKTLVISSEQPSTYIVASDVLNKIISGEKVRVDRKFLKPLEITPHAKLIWSMNVLPRVADAGNGLFRRVKVISFKVVPEGQRDPEIKEQVKEEGPGILNWMLDGLDRLRQRGRFEFPKSVQDSSDHFREMNDVPALFVAEVCVTGKGYRSQSSQLYAAYQEWCARNGHRAQSSTSIAEDWRRLGFERRMSGGRVFWHGVGIVTGGGAVDSLAHFNPNA